MFDDDSLWFAQMQLWAHCATFAFRLFFFQLFFSFFSSLSQQRTIFFSPHAVCCCRLTAFFKHNIKFNSTIERHNGEGCSSREFPTFTDDETLEVNDMLKFYVCRDAFWKRSVVNNRGCFSSSSNWSILCHKVVDEFLVLKVLWNSSQQTERDEKLEIRA